MLGNSLDSCLRRNDEQLATIVIPAKAGIQLAHPNFLRSYLFIKIQNFAELKMPFRKIPFFICNIFQAYKAVDYLLSNQQPSKFLPPLKLLATILKARSPFDYYKKVSLPHYL